MGTTELIDLTASTPPSEPIFVESDPDIQILTETKELGKLSRKKRKHLASRNAEGGLDEEGQTHKKCSLDPRGSRSPLLRIAASVPSIDQSDFFYVDSHPTQLSIPTSTTDSTSAGVPVDGEVKLLLPAHVSVFGGFPFEILPPSTTEVDDESFIEYLDVGDTLPGLTRYFDAEVEDSRPTRVICKKCGEEGEHKASECTVQICLTCGARNEHSTWSCPVSKTCFSCGMKGHINRTCPNRRSRYSAIDPRDHNDCDRCGSRIHGTNECPTLWRLYAYLREDQRASLLFQRTEMRSLSLGQGGEGYVATDIWCYNCGECGHWGDDCRERPRSVDFPSESSAFSEYNTMSGPFFDAASELEPPNARKRDWESNDSIPDGWGKDAPLSVGKRAKKKHKARMEKHELEKRPEDDADDWFNRSRAGVSRNPGPQDRRVGPSNGHKEAKKISIGYAINGAAKRIRPPSNSGSEYRSGSLLERLGNDGRTDSRVGPRDPPPRHSNQRNGGYQEPHRSKRRGSDTYEVEHDRNSGRRDHRGEGGPRYKGGYSRRS